jgi:hypothetical protein
MNKLIVLACAFLTLAVGQTHAQCRVRFCNTPVVATPVIVQERIVELPIAYPVLVPAFQFQYSPPCYAAPAAVQAPCQPVYQQTTSVVYPQGHQQQGGNMYANQGSQQEIAKLAKALLEEMRRQSDQEQNGDGPPTVFDPSAPSGQPLPPVFQPQAEMTRDQAAPLALSALGRACAQCHTGIGSKKDVVIFTQPGLFNPSAPLAAMRREIEAGRMPPQYHNYRLTPSELQALNIWLPRS